MNIHFFFLAVYLFLSASLLKHTSANEEEKEEEKKLFFTTTTRKTPHRFMVGGSYKVAPDDAQFLRLLKGVLPQLSAQLNSSHLFRLGSVLNVARSGSTYMTYWASFELIKTDCLVDNVEKGDKSKDCNDWDEEGRKLVCQARVNKPCCIQNDYPPSADQLECTVSLL